MRNFNRLLLLLPFISLGLFALGADSPGNAPLSSPSSPSSLSSSPSRLRFESPRFLVTARAPGAPNLEYWANFSEKALDRLAPDYGKSPPASGKVEVKVCLSAKDFEQESGMRAENIMAVALTDRGVMVLNVGALAAVSPLEQFQTVGHEMVHLLLGGVQNEASREAPQWLHEGLAQILTGQSRDTASIRLAWAGILGRRIPMSELSASFPHGGAASELAYAQSASFTRYVATKAYAFDSPAAFFYALLCYREQARGILKDLNDPATLAMLETRWHGSMSAGYAWMLAITSTSLLWGGIVALFLVAYIRKRRRERVVMEDWDEWERED